MAQIKASDVKALRESTGVGMMDCKKALMATNGDIEDAIDFLRKKGLSAAEKKAGRIAAEGAVYAYACDDTGVVIEVNAETDFISKNDQFIGFINRLTELLMSDTSASITDVEALKSLAFNDTNSVEEELNRLITTIGEKIIIRRFKRVHIAGGTVAAYIHAGGKIGTLIALADISGDKAQDLARDIAMHAAAVAPRFIGRDDVDAAVVERERAILSERALASGKPAKIVAKIIAGQLRKFYSEVCLIEQDFVKDSDVTIQQHIDRTCKGGSVNNMYRFQLGEGIAKKVNDFAAEVAAQVNG
ncbi:MAG: translation elongation factor Ts [Mariprofundales bacterium]